MIIVGYGFYRRAIISVAHRGANMDVLISLGTIAAYAYSTATTFFISGYTYFDTSVFIFAFVLLGRYLEARAKGGTSEAIRTLLQLKTEFALVITEGGNSPSRLTKSGSAILFLFARVTRFRLTVLSLRGSLPLMSLYLAAKRCPSINSPGMK